MKKQNQTEPKSVVFQDVATGRGFLVNTALETHETIEWTDGKTYPLVKVEMRGGKRPGIPKLYAKRGILLH